MKTLIVSADSTAFLDVFPYIPISYLITTDEPFHLISHFINVAINHFIVMY